jgi:hypothetical protein
LCVLYSVEVIIIWKEWGKGSSTVIYVHEFISLQLKDVGSIDGFRADRLKYTGFQCICGEVFPGRKDNAQSRCNRIGCDATKIEKIEMVKLCCGRYVSQAQITALFKSNIPRLHKHFDYTEARLALEPFLLEKEKRDHTYTHLYLPLIVSCGGGTSRPGLLINESHTRVRVLYMKAPLHK